MEVVETVEFRRLSFRSDTIILFLGSHSIN